MLTTGQEFKEFVGDYCPVLRSFRQMQGQNLTAKQDVQKELNQIYQHRASDSKDLLLMLLSSTHL